MIGQDLDDIGRLWRFDNDAVVENANEMVSLALQNRNIVMKHHPASAPRKSALAGVSMLGRMRWSFFSIGLSKTSTCFASATSSTTRWSLSTPTCSCSWTSSWAKGSLNWNLLWTRLVGSVWGCLASGLWAHQSCWAKYGRGRPTRHHGSSQAGSIEVWHDRFWGFFAGFTWLRSHPEVICHRCALVFETFLLKSVWNYSCGFSFTSVRESQCFQTSIYGYSDTVMPIVRERHMTPCRAIDQELDSAWNLLELGVPDKYTSCTFWDGDGSGNDLGVQVHQAIVGWPIHD